ncbi:MAG: hypothetical protein WBW03_25040, partial [Silvibacterium sp.]
ISVAHLYNLRRSQGYRERRLHYTKTRPTAVLIGERRRPDPQGQPGYLRLDPKKTDLSVHSQADLNKVALRLNQRPRKTLGFESPASKLQASVASTG